MNRTCRYTILIFAMLLTALNMQAQKKITILHTNDLHSSVLGSDTRVDAPGTGGLAAIAGIIQKEKAVSDNPVLVVDAGDFLMGTLFQMLELYSGFQLHLMKVMGYDAVSIGNNEFDFGVENFKKYIERASEKGCPPLVISNIGPPRSGEKNLFISLYTDSILHRWLVIEKEGIRIGIFGLLGDLAYEYTPNLKSYKLKNRVRTARKMVNRLRNEEQVDLVICLSHSGIYKDEEGQWINSEDIELANKVKGIDAIISGHTHTLLKEPLVVKGIPIVQAALNAQYIGKLVLQSGPAKKFEYELIPVTGSLVPDPEVQAEVDKQFNRLKDSLRIYGAMDYEKSCFETAFPQTFIEESPDETNIGPFIADAIYYNVNNNTRGTNIALFAQGMIRTGLDAGIQRLPQVFQTASLGSGNDKLPGYALSRMYFSAHEIKLVLELLNVVAAKDPTYYCFMSGMEVSIGDKGGLLNKIKTMKILDDDGIFHEIDFSKKNKKLYSVTADTYMMEFMTVLKKKSLGLVNVKPKTADGEKITDFSTTIIDFDASTPGIQEGKVWGSVVTFAESFNDTDNDGIPDVPDHYLK